MGSQCIDASKRNCINKPNESDVGHYRAAHILYDCICNNMMRCDESGISMSLSKITQNQRIFNLIFNHSICKQIIID